MAKTKAKTTVKAGAKKKASNKAKKQTSLIGIDPLAWLDAEEMAEASNDDATEETVVAKTVATKAKQEDKTEALELSASDVAISKQIMENTSESVTAESKAVAAGSGNDNDRDNSGDKIDIDLGKSLTIRDISQLMESLEEIDDSKEELVFEMANLEKVDTAALQLLLGYYLFATQAGKKVTWHEPSKVLCHAAGLIGLQEILNLKTLSA